MHSLSYFARMEIPHVRSGWQQAAFYVISTNGRNLALCSKRFLPSLEMTGHECVHFAINFSVFCFLFSVFCFLFSVEWNTNLVSAENHYLTKMTTSQSSGKEKGLIMVRKSADAKKPKIPVSSTQPVKPKDGSFPIVGIGASAGG